VKFEKIIFTDNQSGNTVQKFNKLVHNKLD